MTRIGTLQEKSVHKALKSRFVPDEKYHEIKIGSFYADVCHEGEIYEIQTKKFYLLKKKLDYFLKDYDVTVVYPVSVVNTIVWIDPVTGELTKSRATRNRRLFYRFFREIYALKDYYDRPNLHFVIVRLETEDYRLLDGYGPDKKKHATKTDKIPLAFCDDIVLPSVYDIRSIIPKELGEKFSANDFAKATGLNANDTSKAMLVLMALDIVERTGKENKSFTYKMK